MPKGYFSLVQFCPNLSRREVANIGVVLFCPAVRFLGVRMSPDNSRVRQFFLNRALGDSHLDAMKAAFVARLETEGGEFRAVADMTAFAEKLANSILLTPPRWTRVDVPEQTLAGLFDELVLDPGLAPASATLTEDSA